MYCFPKSICRCLKIGQTRPRQSASSNCFRRLNTHPLQCVAAELQYKGMVQIAYLQVPWDAWECGTKVLALFWFLRVHWCGGDWMSYLADKVVIAWKCNKTTRETNLLAFWQANNLAFWQSCASFLPGTACSLCGMSGRSWVSTPRVTACSQSLPQHEVQRSVYVRCCPSFLKLRYTRKKLVLGNWSPLRCVQLGCKLVSVWRPQSLSCVLCGGDGCVKMVCAVYANSIRSKDWAGMKGAQVHSAWCVQTANQHQIWNLCGAMAQLSTYIQAGVGGGCDGLLGCKLLADWFPLFASNYACACQGWRL